MKKNGVEETQTRDDFRILCMINPNGDDFIDKDPLGASTEGMEGPALPAAEGRFRETSQSMASAAGEAWEQTKQKAGTARERTEFFLRENPVPTILGALGIGLAIGLAIRYASSRSEREVEVKTPLGNVNWSVLTLPFLWPFFRSVRDRVEDSADVVKGGVKDGVKRLRKVDVESYVKPIRKRWKAWTD